MGIHRKSGDNGARRSSYPSGPWINGIKPAGYDRTYTPPATPKTEPPPQGNPDPTNYQIIKAEEVNGYLIVKIKYPNCTNYEGEKILVYKNMTLIKLVNQKVIDPHFFNDKTFASPVARFVPTQEGWEMSVIFTRAMK